MNVDPSQQPLPPPSPFAAQQDLEGRLGKARPVSTFERSIAAAEVLTHLEKIRQRSRCDESIGAVLERHHLVDTMDRQEYTKLQREAAPLEELSDRFKRSETAQRRYTEQRSQLEGRVNSLYRRALDFFRIGRGRTGTGRG